MVRCEGSIVTAISLSGDKFSSSSFSLSSSKLSAAANGAVITQTAPFSDALLMSMLPSARTFGFTFFSAGVDVLTDDLFPPNIDIRVEIEGFSTASSDSITFDAFTRRSQSLLYPMDF